MPKRASASDVFDALDRVGLPQPYVRALLPSWWDDRGADSPAGMAEFKLMLSRSLGVSVEELGDERPTILFKLPHVRKLKRSIRYSENQLTPALSVALAAAKVAVAACPIRYSPLPPAAELRNSILSTLGGKYVSLRGLLRICWLHGIPVLHVGSFPDGMPKMDGVVASIDGRPAIVLAKRTLFSAWMSFVLTHEMGHIAEGHFRHGELLIDESLTDSPNEGTPLDAEELAADRYALEVLGHAGDIEQQLAATSSPSDMARAAMTTHRQLGVDAGHTLLRFAYTTGQWDRAVAALKVLDTQLSAVRDVHAAMLHEIDPSLVADSSLAFLHRVCGIVPES
jgi:hypothetical protein